MKKAIGELTLNEVVDVCKKCDEEKIEHCPFVGVPFIQCFTNDKKRRLGLNEEIEVVENG